MRLADMMKALAELPTNMRVVILDACRNNPFVAIQKTTGRGLAIVDAPTGSIVAYATAPGQEALDGGAAGNSPYTAALVEAMRQPNLQIEQVFKNVRVKVNAVTGGKQVPWETSSLHPELRVLRQSARADRGGCPARAGGTGGPEAPATEGVPPPAPVAVASTDFSAIAKAKVESIKTLPAEKAYDVVIEENSVEAYEEFIRAYPEDPRCRQIRVLLHRRNQMVAWRNAVVSNTPEAYEAYADIYPESDHVASARRLRVQPRLRPIDQVIARPIHLPISRVVRVSGTPDRSASSTAARARSSAVPAGHRSRPQHRQRRPGQRAPAIGLPGQGGPGQGNRVNSPGQGNPRVGLPGQGGPGQGNSRVTTGTGTPRYASGQQPGWPRYTRGHQPGWPRYACGHQPGWSRYARGHQPGWPGTPGSRPAPVRRWSTRLAG